MNTKLMNLIALLMMAAPLVAAEQATVRLQRVLGHLQQMPVAKPVVVRPAVAEEAFIRTMQSIPHVSAQYGAEIAANKTLMANILGQGQALSRDFAVVYHGCSAEVCMIQDLIYLLEQRKNGNVPAHHVYLRAPGMGSKLNNVQEFLGQSVPSNGYFADKADRGMAMAGMKLLASDTFADMEKDMRDVVLSANIGFLANTANSGSCTLDYFFRGKSRMLDNIDGEKILAALVAEVLTHYAVSPDEAPRFVELAKKYLHDKRALLQIGVPRHRVNDFLYLCDPGGSPLIAQLMYRDGTVVAQEDWDANKGRYKKIDGVLAAYEKDPSAIVGADHLQVRILLTQELLTPACGLQTHRYWNPAPQARYHQELASLVEHACAPKDLVGKAFSMLKQLVVSPPAVPNSPNIEQATTQAGQHLVDQILRYGTLVNDIEAGNVSAVQQKIATLDQRGKDVAMAHAAAKGKLEIVKMLKRLGANCDFVDKHGMTPLHYAVGGHNEAMVREVVTPANMRIPSAEGFLPIQLAAHLNNLPMMKLLVSYGASLHDPLPEGRTIYFLGMDTEITRWLIQQGVKLGEKEHWLIVHHAKMGAMEARKSRSPLASCDLDIVDAFLKQGVSPNTVFEEIFPMSLLQALVSSGNTHPVAWLIGKGADVNLKTRTGTALLTAVESGNMELVQLLVKHGADIGVQSGLHNMNAIELADNTAVNSRSRYERDKWFAIGDWLRAELERQKAAQRR